MEVVDPLTPYAGSQAFSNMGAFFRLVHLSKNTPTLLVKEAFAVFDDCVQQCFSECTAVDTPGSRHN